MILWYNVYSFWVIGLFILYITHIIRFSIIPAVIGACIGTICFLIWKIYAGIPMNITFVSVQIVLHLFPFFVLPLQFTQRDILIHCMIFIIYLLWLTLQGYNFFTLYREIVYEDGRVTLIGYAKRRGLI
jgi:hypothetical protein